MNIIYEKYRKHFLVAGLIIILIAMIIIAFLPRNVTNPSDANMTPTISTTVTSTPILPNKPSINFSGFSSNIKLTFKGFSNIGNIIPKGNVYYATMVNKDYFVTALKFQGNNGVYQNSEYSVEIANDGSSILTNKSSVRNGNLSLEGIKSTFINFYKTKLLLDPKNVDININKVKENYQIIGNMKVDNLNVYTLNSNPSFLAVMSSSGQILKMYIYNIFIPTKTIGEYSLEIPNPKLASSIDPYTFGIWVDLSQNSFGKNTFFTDNINITSTTKGYYYDTTSSYLIPVIKLDGNFNAYNVATTYNAIMLLNPINQGYIVKTTPTPINNNLGL